MRKLWGHFFTLGVLCIGFATWVEAAPLKPGTPAPDFTAKGSDGKTYALADYKGKFVVLQWYNRDCPFIHKHYDSANMQMLQNSYGKKGVIWFEVLSSAPGREGYMTAAEAQENRAKCMSRAIATLLDPDGKVGQLYEAKTTPHVFVIDPMGILIYNGAIDDHPTPYAQDLANSKNYVAAALDEAMAGKPVTTSLTRPYGCGVKYR